MNRLNRIKSFFANPFSTGGAGEDKVQARTKAASAILLIYGSSIVFFLFVSILIASLAFFLQFSLPSFHLPLTILFSLLFVILSCSLLPRPERGTATLVLFALLVASFFLSFLFSQRFFDLSFDGQAYHQEALFQLVEGGWNPFYQPLSRSEANHMGYWLQHYSKGVWIYEAMIFKVTQDIEAAKLFHTWLMTAAFSLTLSFLLRIEKFPFLLALVISLLTACNPVSIYQSLSFYLDGQLMSLLVIFIAILALIYREPDRYLYFLLFIIVSVLVNVKLTAGIYAILILCGYAGLLWMGKRIQSLRGVLIGGLTGLFLGFILFGFSPYVTNTLSMGNPFYPALGTDRSDFTAPQFPANFSGRNPGFLLFYSIFAKSDNVRGPDKMASLKIPFRISRDEMKAFTDTNAKQGGFGPLFGGAILLSFVVILGALIDLYESRRKKQGGISNRDSEKIDSGRKFLIITGLFCLSLILATCLINPASSLARFIPQMWLFPIFAFFLAHISTRRFFRIIGSSIILTLLLNNALIAFAYYKYNFEITKVYRQRMLNMAKESQENPIPFYFGQFRSSSSWRFDRLGIIYEVIVKKEECKNGKRILPNSIALRCSPG